MAAQTPDAAGSTSPSAQLPPPDLDALVAVTLARHPGLDDAGLEAVRRLLTQTVQAAVAMRAYPLTNADEPDLIFSAYRGD